MPAFCVMISIGRRPNVTPKCPLCGTPLKAIRGYDTQGITRNWVAGCYNCFFQSSHFWKTKKACIEDMERLLSLFPPLLRVQVGDKLTYFGTNDIVTVVRKDLETCEIKIEDTTGAHYIIEPKDVHKWPWELGQEGGQQ